MLSDAHPDNFWEPGTQVAQSDDPKTYTVNLVEEDARGGHAYRDHVAKSDGELIAIVRNDVYRGPVLDLQRRSFSTYESLEAANDFTNQVLKENSPVVNQVASGELRSVWVEKRFGYLTGKEAFRTRGDGPIIIRRTYNAGAYIVHDARSKRGYRVHTSYPFNEYEK